MGGGDTNTAGFFSTVGGGYINTASGSYSIVGGGYNNWASGKYSIIAGGASSIASGMFSTVCGGYENTASGDYSVALGNMATAQYPGSFVWGDSSNFTVADNGPNEFLARSTGGAAFITAINPMTGAVTAGVYVPAGSGSWTSLSDRGQQG